MVRRWSRVTNIIRLTSFKKKSYFFYFYSSFRGSIIFKKLRFKNTKFKRKTLIRAKHKGNWIIYSQIFKNWSFDFQFSKTYIKYQLYSNLNSLSFSVYNFSLIDNSKKSDTSKNFCISNHLTRKFFSFLTSLCFDKFSPFSLTHSFLANINDFDLYREEKSILMPIFIVSNFTHFELREHKNEIVSIEDLTQFSYDLVLKQLTFHYQNLICLWLNVLIKV